jgi:hypothetical protein
MFNLSDAEQIPNPRQGSRNARSRVIGRLRHALKNPI